MSNNLLEIMGVKREAILVVPTICNKCKKPFLDKVYSPGIHKVKCPHCGLVNATTNFKTMEKLKEMGERYDIGTLGGLGGVPKHVEKPQFLEKAKEKRESLYKLLDSAKKKRIKEMEDEDHISRRV